MPVQKTKSSVNDSNNEVQYFNERAAGAELTKFKLKIKKKKKHKGNY